ncbi:MAG: hypothetical protein IGS50_22555 [Synechococcales cyanobacterium C42_A2020_086]|jgi:hypothetical protein|nr:hypothetical protein [Synechococcales cyanobacterium C42_A2020_086]
MLYFIAVWLVLLPVCYLIGVGCLNGLQADRFRQASDRQIAALWLGVVMLSVVLLATSIVLPLSLGVGAAIAASLVGVALLSKLTRIEVKSAWRSLTRWQWGTVLAVAVMVAATALEPVTWLDSGLYHFSLIRWLNRYGIVPGLALLFSNLGFNSSWFALAAPLNPEAIAEQVSAVTNGFAVLLLSLSGLLGLRQCVRGQPRLSDRFLVLLCGSLLLLSIGSGPLSDIRVSPSPDLPALYLTGITVWSLLVSAQPEPIADAVDTADTAVDATDTAASSLAGRSAVVPLILATGAVTVKLTTLPLLLVVGVFFAVTQRPLRLHSLLMGAIIVSGLLAPLLLAGILTSGCPLYPSSVLCLDLPWSLSIADAQEVAKDTHAWTSWYGPAPAGVHPWLWPIWRWLNERTTNKLMVIAALISLAATGYIVWVRLKSRSAALHGALWGMAVGWAGTGFIALLSPFLRFAVTYLLLPILLALAIYTGRAPKWQQWQRLASRRLVPLATCFLAMLLTLRHTWNAPSRWLLPDPMPQPDVVLEQVNDVVYWSPREENTVCWTADLPCAFEVKPDVQMRLPAQGLQGGYMRRPD